MVFSDSFKKFSTIFLKLFIVLLVFPFDASATGKYLFDPPSGTNLFPQPSDNSGFTKRDNGIINSNQSYSYKYDYAQKQHGHGMDLISEWIRM
ncbi:hypothetical protein ACJ7K1_07800 [Paenibacillus elgii]